MKPAWLLSFSLLFLDIGLSAAEQHPTGPTSYELHPALEMALFGILLRDCEFRWTRLAALSSMRNGEEKVFESLFRNEPFITSITESKLSLVRELADLIGARAGLSSTNAFTSVLSRLAQRATEERVRKVAVDGLIEGMTRSGADLRSNPQWRVALEKISDASSTALLASAWKLSRLLGLPETERQSRALAEARQLAKDPSQPLEVRIANIRLLGLGSFSVVQTTLLSLLDGTEPSFVQLAAIEVLRQYAEPELARSLVEKWRSLTPGARPLVINLLLQRRPFHEFLIEAIESEKMKLGELNLDLEQRRKLLRDGSAETKARAAKLLGDEEYSNDSAAVARCGGVPAGETVRSADVRGCGSMSESIQQGGRESHADADVCAPIGCVT